MIEVLSAVTAERYLLVGALAALGLQTWYASRGIRITQSVVLILLLAWPVAIPVGIGAFLLGIVSVSFRRKP